MKQGFSTEWIKGAIFDLDGDTGLNVDLGGNRKQDTWRTWN